MPLKQGSTVALVTPYHPDGNIDFPALETLLNYHVESQTDGLCILGTTGEASLLTMEERKAILDCAVKIVKGKIPMMVGTGSIDPNAVKEMTQQAIDCGCDASLVVSPPYIKPPQRGLVNHFLTMADLGLPVVIYNVPGRTAVDVLPETIGLCAGHEHIVAVKEATGDLSRVAAIRAATSDLEIPLLLYSGDDDSEAEFVLQGGDGCISVTANVAAASMHEMMMACLAGDREKAMDINAKLSGIHNTIFCESNPIPAKWALKRMGMINSAFCRPPLMEMDPKFNMAVEEVLKTAGVWKF
jgi:4-hydroxy-tetrahydrodipicolinate synthase